MTGTETQAASRRKLMAAARAIAGSRNPTLARPLPPALFLTDPARTPDPVAVASRLPRGWGVVYRHFGASDRLTVASDLARVCRRRALVFLVAADPGLARRVGADGVHWPERLRSKGRPGGFAIETQSAHLAASLRRAGRVGLSALLVSTVFESGSPSAGAPMGPFRFRALARRSPLPCYALGGVSASTAGRLTGGHGIAGWAAVDAIAGAWGPYQV